MLRISNMKNILLRFIIVILFSSIIKLLIEDCLLEIMSEKIIENIFNILKIC